MDSVTKKHRTFELLDPSRVGGTDACQTQCHPMNRSRDTSFDLSGTLSPSRSRVNADDPLQRELERLEQMNRRTISTPKPKPYHPSQMDFSVLKLSEGALERTTIIEHLHQDFGTHATEWERRFSKLVIGAEYNEGKSNRLTTTPVVNAEYTVIGYIVVASGQEIFGPMREVARMTTHNLNEYLDLDIPLYTDDRRMEFWLPVSASEVTYTVLTAVDGQVVAYVGSDTVGIEATDCWLLDVITVGGAVARLGRAAVMKAAKSLMRRSAKASKSLAGRTRELGRRIVKRASKRFQPGREYIRRSGIPRNHYREFQATAAETEMLVLVRNVNLKSTPLITKGCPGKGMAIKAKTSRRTGVVTAKSQKHIGQAYEEGYFVVDADRVARRRIRRGGKEVVEELPLKSPFWTVKKGQLIAKGNPPKPLTSDYDLMGVVNPKSPGQNVSLAARGEDTVADFSGIEVDTVREVLNRRLREKRVFHGAQDQFGGFDGGATVFFPDGRSLYLRSERQVKAFYKSLKRKTKVGTYNPKINRRPAPRDMIKERRERIKAK